MILSLRSVFLLCAGCFVLACTTQSAEDTDHHSFVVDCKQRPCQLQLPSSDPTGPRAQYSLRAQGRYLLACAPSESNFNCRSLICKNNDPCASLGGVDFSCHHGLCEAKTHTLTSDDQLALCLAGSGSWTGTAQQRTRLTLVRSLNEHATIPAACALAEN